MKLIFNFFFANKNNFFYFDNKLEDLNIKIIIFFNLLISLTRKFQILI